jgi:radical SAM enzyme (TIGR01210 family)
VTVRDLSPPALSSVPAAVYPEAAAGRDRFVLDRRATRPAPDPWRHQGLLVEDERAADGRLARTLTVFLTGRECPWRCVMCDLWRHTIESDTPRGAIAAQLHRALAEVRAAPAPPPSAIKLYNAGSFFDPRAVPEGDYDEIAARVSGFDQVVVESHPALVGERVDRLLEALTRMGRGEEGPRLEVAMGLETAHPLALERLHKRMTVEQFARASEALAGRGASVRAFLLVHPPFVDPGAQDEWLERSVDFASSCGASVVSLIPTRAGNGALEALATAGLFEPPRLADVERALALALPRSRCRVFADLWDLGRFSDCPACLPARAERLRRANLDQCLGPRVACERCGGSAA